MNWLCTAAFEALRTFLRLVEAQSPGQLRINQEWTTLHGEGSSLEEPLFSFHAWHKHLHSNAKESTELVNSTLGRSHSSQQTIQALFLLRHPPWDIQLPTSKQDTFAQLNTNRKVWNSPGENWEMTTWGIVLGSLQNVFATIFWVGEQTASSTGFFFLFQVEEQKSRN